MVLVCDLVSATDTIIFFEFFQCVDKKSFINECKQKLSTRVNGAFNIENINSAHRALFDNVPELQKYALGKSILEVMQYIASPDQHQTKEHSIKSSVSIETGVEDLNQLPPAYQRSVDDMIDQETIAPHNFNTVIKKLLDLAHEVETQSGPHDAISAIDRILLPIIRNLQKEMKDWCTDEIDSIQHAVRIVREELQFSPILQHTKLLISRLLPISNKEREKQRMINNLSSDILRSCTTRDTFDIAVEKLQQANIPLEIETLRLNTIRIDILQQNRMDNLTTPESQIVHAADALIRSTVSEDELELAVQIAANHNVRYDDTAKELHLNRIKMFEQRKDEKLNGKPIKKGTNASNSDVDIQIPKVRMPRSRQGKQKIQRVISKHALKPLVTFDAIDKIQRPKNSKKIITKKRGKKDIKNRKKKDVTSTSEPATSEATASESDVTDSSNTKSDTTFQNLVEDTKFISLKLDKIDEQMKELKSFNDEEVMSVSSVATTFHTVINEDRDDDGLNDESAAIGNYDDSDLPHDRKHESQNVVTSDNDMTIHDKLLYDQSAVQEMQ